MHVEVADFVGCAGWIVRMRLGSVCRSGPLDSVRPHVIIDTFYRRARPFKKTSPVFRVRRKDLGLIAVDERLKNTLDVRANRGRISRTIVVDSCRSRN